MMPSPAQGYHRHGYQPEPAIRRNEPTMSTSSSLADAIRSIPDYPKPGIMFRDITTLLGDARAFRRTVDELVQPYAGLKVDKVAGIEARGFILGGAWLTSSRPGSCRSARRGSCRTRCVFIAYSLEYGLDEMEMHEDAVAGGERVILVDDLIATAEWQPPPFSSCAGWGGCGGGVFVIDLPALGGADKLRALDVPVCNADLVQEEDLRRTALRSGKRDDCKPVVRIA